MYFLTIKAHRMIIISDTPHHIFKVLQLYCAFRENMIQE